MTTLALSGGGFRATLFHLGVIRYLHDVNLLRSIDLVCGVSGGAIMAAHLVHNWERYTGADGDFAAAATEIVELTQQDVRGRITRRLPWIGLMATWPWRRSRTAEFREALERFFGNTYLSAAAATGRPDLHILATNLNTGGPWDFHPHGFYTEKSRDQSAGTTDPFVRTTTGFVTTAFAVCASACFPAFFPPCKVDAKALGIETPELDQYLGDGGIYDNLGVRTLRRLEESHPEPRPGPSIRPASFNIISDAGAAFDMRSSKKFSGILRTAFRAVDIMSERVESLAYEALSTPSHMLKEPLVVIRLREPVPRRAFAGVPHESLQTALRNLRTDLDRFSDTEIKWLVRQGYAATREKIERAAATQSIEVGSATLERGTNAPWDPVTKTGDDGQPEHDRRIYDTLQPGSRRSFRLFAIRDIVSWVNVTVFVVVTAVFALYYRNVTNQAKFFTEAYPRTYAVTMRYEPDAAQRWVRAFVPPAKQDLLFRYLDNTKHDGRGSRTHSRLLDFVNADVPAGGLARSPAPVVEALWTKVASQLEDRPQRFYDLDRLITSAVSDARLKAPIGPAERQFLKDLAAAWRMFWLASKWSEVQGKRGVGRAFAQIIGKTELPVERWPGVRQTVSRFLGIPSSNADVFTDIERDQDSLWKGILYYRFPRRGWLSYLPEQLVAEFTGDMMVFDFEGRMISKDGGHDLCVSFVQRPGDIARQDIQLAFDDRRPSYIAEYLFPSAKEQLDPTWVRDGESRERLCACFKNGAAASQTAPLKTLCEPKSDPPVSALTLGNMSIVSQ